MSEMEVFYGWFAKSDLPIEPEDTDDFYELEEEHKCHFVKVDGHLYAFASIKEVDAYGFAMVIEPSDKNRLIAMWYNGGAGIHEVVEDAIRGHLARIGGAA